MAFILSKTTRRKDWIAVKVAESRRVRGKSRPYPIAHIAEVPRAQVPQGGSALQQIGRALLGAAIKESELALALSRDEVGKFEVEIENPFPQDFFGEYTCVVSETWPQWEYYQELRAAAEEAKRKAAKKEERLAKLLAAKEKLGSRCQGRRARPARP